MHLTAITADSAWRTALQDSETATVESVFSRALNLRLDNGELLSIFPKGSPNMPGGLVVSHDANQMFGQAGEHIQITKNNLSFAETDISVASCQFIDNSLGSQRIPLPDTSTLDQFESMVKDKARPGSFYGAITDDVFNIAQVARLQKSRAGFQQALRRQSTSGIAQTAAQLVGLGIGLTPSGDDYLLGHLLVLNHSAMADSLSLAALRQAIATNLESTTTVSRGYLQASLNRRYSQPLRSLLQEASSRTGSIEVSLGAALAHGATSGQDTCTGMIDAWRLLLNNS